MGRPSDVRPANPAILAKSSNWGRSITRRDDRDVRPHRDSIGNCAAPPGLGSRDCGALYFRSLLVHVVDQLRKPCDHGGEEPVRHLRRDLAGPGSALRRCPAKRGRDRGISGKRAVSETILVLLVFWRTPANLDGQDMAETEGFEPSVRVNPVRRFSKPLVSATHPRLREAARSRGLYNRVRQAST